MSSLIASPAVPARIRATRSATIPLSPTTPWWVYYEPPGANRIPADDAHLELVTLVNALKDEMVQSQGGAFSINEHGQVIARTTAPPGQGNSMHLIGVSAGIVATFTKPILFQQGQLSPVAVVAEGQPWPGPLCGMSYSFVAPGNLKAPSRNPNEVFVEEEGQVLLLSRDGGIDPYPPPTASYSHSFRRSADNSLRVADSGSTNTAAPSLRTARSSSARSPEIVGFDR